MPSARPGAGFPTGAHRNTVTRTLRTCYSQSSCKDISLLGACGRSTLVPDSQGSSGSASAGAPCCCCGIWHVPWCSSGLVDNAMAKQHLCPRANWDGVLRNLEKDGNPDAHYNVMNLEDVALSEISQPRKDRFCRIPPYEVLRVVKDKDRYRK